MVTEVIAVSSIGELTEGVEGVREGWTDVRSRALYGALMNSRFLPEVWRRTPQHDRRRGTKDSKERRDGGNQALVKSILPNGVRMDAFRRYSDLDTVTFSIGSDKPYAQYVNEMTNPPEGRYWDRRTQGSRARGWSKPGSGNRFLSLPAEVTRDEVREELRTYLLIGLKGCLQ